MEAINIISVIFGLTIICLIIRHRILNTLCIGIVTDKLHRIEHGTQMFYLVIDKTILIKVRLLEFTNSEYETRYTYKIRQIDEITDIIPVDRSYESTSIP